MPKNESRTPKSKLIESAIRKIISKVQSESKVKTKNKLNEDAQQVAQTIIKQLGGIGKLKAMVGAYDIMYDSRAKLGGLMFKFKGSPKANYVKIVLDHSDTYDIEFGKLTKANYKVVKELDGIYWDQLKEIFEDTTGLYLSL